MGAYVSWVDAIALSAIGYKYYIVYMPLVIIQWVLAYRYMVETQGYTLEEVAIAFDGPEAFVPDVDRFLRKDGHFAPVQDVDRKSQEDSK